MRRNLAMFAAWVLATIASVAVAAGAVGVVRDQVTDRPSPLATTLPPVAGGGTPTLGATATTSAVRDATTSMAPVETTGRPGVTTTVTATTVTPTGSSTTTTLDPSTTSTTTAAPAPSVAPPAELTTYELRGGWVRLRTSLGLVVLDGAAPSPGYTMEIDEQGPISVEIEFSSDEGESRLRAKWDGDELDVDIDESDG